jgi:hypothetical protein
MAGCAAGLAYFFRPRSTNSNPTPIEEIDSDPNNGDYQPLGSFLCSVIVRSFTDR